MERIDPNHPAWPGAKKKTRNPPASPPIRAEEQAAPPPPAPDNLTPITPASESEVASLLDAFAAPEEGLPESEPAPVPLPEPTTAAGSTEEPPPPLVPADERQPAVAVAVLEEEEDEKDSGAPDWEGLAQSRLAQFEAKARDGKPKKKAVDLEKEWARSAAVQIAAKTEVRERARRGRMIPCARAHARMRLCVCHGAYLLLLCLSVQVCMDERWRAHTNPKLVTNPKPEPRRIQQLMLQLARPLPARLLQPRPRARGGGVRVYSAGNGGKGGGEGDKRIIQTSFLQRGGG